MIVIKRNGQEVEYEESKISTAISKAVADVVNTGVVVDGNLANKVATRLSKKYAKANLAVTVEDIQDDVETELMKEKEYEVAKAYIRYRYEHELKRGSSSVYDKILSIVEGVNETVIQENSNKNPIILSTQRDYIAGEISRDMSMNELVPKEIKTAHEEGIIQFHDSDYFIQKLFNCALINLEDMLQNGTVISGTMIEKPHSFSTACNVATQVVAQVASNQYGGQSITLSHLAPFVDVSRQKIKKDVLNEMKLLLGHEPKTLDEIGHCHDIVEKRLREEIRKGVQTIQYQVVTLMTTNGQAPFVTVFMYLNEVKDPQTKKDLAMIIEEVIAQRIQGVKNEKGVWTTPAFPKLIYVLEEDNITEDAPYWYLTELAAKCTAKRMVPDYISEKKMLEYKIDKNGNGNCYPCMGCRSFLTPFVDENGKPKYYGRLTA